MSKRKIKQFIQLLALASSCFIIYLFLPEKSQTSRPVVQTSISLPRAALNLDELISNSKRDKYRRVSSLVKHNKDKAYNGFTIYPVSGTEEILLLNMSGVIVHRWEGIDADRVRLLPSGNILVLHGSKNLIKQEPWASLRKRISEYDWNGKLVWKYDGESVLHHDLQYLENGNILTLIKAKVPENYNNKITDPFRKSVELKADSVIEISREGKIVWRWNAWESIDVNECGVRECPGQHTFEKRGGFDKDDYQDWTHINTVNLIPENKWYDAGDQRFRPGNILVHARNFWTSYIIDRDTKEIVWDYSGDYKGGIIGGHEASMIPKGYPGEGNIIILDNGSEKRNNSSFILEVNPNTKNTEWVYDVGDKFFTRARGSVQRLANGNTLISEDRNGRVLEVTPDKETVWEYKGNLLSVRAGRYAPDYSPKFIGLNLF